MPGAHLHVHSAFSFLRGSSTPEALVAEAVKQGIDVLALTDDHRVSGMVPFLTACEQAGIKGIVGAEVQVEELGRLVLLVPDTQSYPALTELLTQAHLRQPRGAPKVTWDLLAQFGSSLIALTGDRQGLLAHSWLSGDTQAIESTARHLQDIFPPGHLYVEIVSSLLPGDRLLFQALQDIAEHFGWPLIATGGVHYARKEDFGLFDLMTCIRTGQRIEDVGPERYLNAENYLKPWDRVAKEMRLWPEAVQQALDLGEKLGTPDVLHHRYAPLFTPPSGTVSWDYLVYLVKSGAQRRYGAEAPRVLPRIERELSVIRDMGFADYFLVVWDVARYARSQHIRYAGRGSAADSVVAYCLGITDVDAFRRNLLFERFMSRERQETPDIDIDFDARFRDQVEGYVRERYGASHVARVATYQTYRQRLSVREIGKVLGFPPTELDALAKSLPEASIASLLARWQEIPELRQYPDSERLKLALSWAARIEGLPRHIGTHLGGVVVSQRPLSEIGPREWSHKGIEIIQFDKRDIEAMGLMKLDLLSLRTFSAVEMTVQEIQKADSGFSYDALPLEDDATYRRLQAGEGVGVFQLESPAQRALARRLEPDRWEDIVASLALIRPGPIKGNMVEPFIARRRGEEPVTYLHPDLEPILSKTYGVVLFQEQVIAIASTLAGFSPGEADALRRVMTHARSPQDMASLGDTFKAKAMARGVEETVAEAVFQQMVGYASYGFNEAHAAAFAETAYRTAYLLEHHPRAHFLGLLNAEPLGYYPVDVLLVEARNRGVEIRPIDINRSQTRVIQEDPHALRLGMGFLRGLNEEIAEEIVAQRPSRGYRHPEEVLETTRISRTALQALIAIGAFDSISMDREGLREDVQGPNPLTLSVAGDGRHARWTRAECAWADYQHLGFGQHEQWMALWRDTLAREGFLTSRQIRETQEGRAVRMVGMVYRPHRPPTRSGRLMVFFSVLDELGLVEARLSTEGYQRFGHHLFGPVDKVLAIAGMREQAGIRVTTIAPWPPRV